MYNKFFFLFYCLIMINKCNGNKEFKNYNNSTLNFIQDNIKIEYVELSTLPIYIHPSFSSSFISLLIYIQ